MSALNKKIFLCFLTLFWIGNIFSQEAESNDLQGTVKNYPSWLAEKGDCFRAKSESLRYYFIRGKSLDATHPSLIACQFYLGNYQEVVNLAEGYLSLKSNQKDERSNYAEHLLTFSYLKLGKAQKAKESWAYYVDLDNNDPILLNSDIQGRINVETAGTYSAILPGAGFLVSRSYGKAVLAFLLNGIFIAGTYQAYHSQQFGVAGLLLFFEIGWYKGGINAAEEEAENYNRQIVQRYQDAWIKSRLKEIRQ